jgi:cystathionine gamma-synthase
MFMERNSRDFISRVDRINHNTEALCDMLRSHPQGEHNQPGQNSWLTITVKEVYYPKYSDTRNLYDACRTENGGYGGLFSVTLHSTANAIKFYDSIAVAKGPSLGTNFTLR